jgi:hypothetical protein
MKATIILIVLCATLILAGSMARAQDGGELKCTDADVSAAVDEALAGLQAAQGQDAATAYEATRQVKAELATLDSLCLGLDFEGSATNVVSDPVIIPAGVYRVTVTTNGYFMMSGTVLEGRCTDAINLFILSEGDAVTGAQAVLESEGCTVLWEISTVSAPPYTVTFEKIK